MKIAHNAKFDAKWVGHHLGAEVNGIFDTLIASQLITDGDQDRAGIIWRKLRLFFSATELDKSEQVSDRIAAELSPSQIEYAARDAATMIPLREKIVERLRQNELIKVAKLEFDCVMAITKVELKGFFLDEGRWREQLEKVKKNKRKSLSKLRRCFRQALPKPGFLVSRKFNLDSQQQVTDAS